MEQGGTERRVEEIVMKTGFEIAQKLQEATTEAGLVERQVYIGEYEGKQAYLTVHFGTFTCQDDDPLVVKAYDAEHGFGYEITRQVTTTEA